MSLKRKVVIALIILVLGIQFIPTNVNQNTEIQKTDITYKSIDKKEETFSTLKRCV